jgi:CRISP-associated protein Cas1
MLPPNLLTVPQIQHERHVGSKLVNLTTLIEYMLKLYNPNVALAEVSKCPGGDERVRACGRSGAGREFACRDADSADDRYRRIVAIVGGKIRNMIAMIRRQRRLRADSRPLVAELEALLPKVAGATDLDALNGYEGTASAAYFRAFRAALKGDWKFEARQYRPPADPVNALLSFGYTLLHNDVFAGINVVGLDPYAGTFHRPRQGHAALASDLMEEHRAIVVDRLVLTALNKRIVVETDFVLTPANQFRLAQEALKRFLALYARQINEVVLYPAQGVRTSYRQVIEWQARQFARVVLGEEEVYRPFQPTDSGWERESEEE